MMAYSGVGIKKLGRATIGAFSGLRGSVTFSETLPVFKYTGTSRGAGEGYPKSPDCMGNN